MTRTRNLLSGVFLAGIMYGSPGSPGAVLHADDGSICVATETWCAASCVTTTYPSYICARKNVRTTTMTLTTTSRLTRAATPQIDLCPNITDAKVGRSSASCKDYCENNGCTPGYQRGPCPPGTHASTIVDSCGCKSCIPIDCSHCAYEAGGPAECGLDGGYYDDECGCCVEPWTPIIVSLDDKRKPEMSDCLRGVSFDLTADGQREPVPWPIDEDDAWLVLDRNDNGAIDNGGELFGNFTLLSNGQRAGNGFISLAELDTNRNGEIDRGDTSFKRLRLWRDRFRNGFVDAGELVALGPAGIRSISLDYREVSPARQIRKSFQVQVEGRVRIWQDDVGGTQRGTLSRRSAGRGNR